MNRFSHITSHKKISEAALHPQAQNTGATSVKGQPKQSRLGREAYDTLMGLLSEDTESPTTPYGVLIANSTKRNLKKQVERLFQP